MILAILLLIVIFLIVITFFIIFLEVSKVTYDVNILNDPITVKRNKNNSYNETISNENYPTVYQECIKIAEADSTLKITSITSVFTLELLRLEVIIQEKIAEKRNSIETNKD